MAESRKDESNLVSLDNPPLHSKQTDPLLEWLGPIGRSGLLWMTCWFSLNVGLTLMNKYLFVGDFKFPATLSMLHMIATSFWSSVVLALVPTIPRKTLSSWQMLGMFMYSLLFCANITVGNFCLHYVSVSLVQVVRSVIPGITIVLSVLVLGKSYALPYYLSIALVVVGVALASYGELNLHVVGFLLTVLVCFLSSLKSVITGRMLVSDMKFHTMDLLQRMSMLAAMEMALVAWMRGELLDVWLQSEVILQPSFVGMLIANGCMAFALNFANFTFTKTTSPLTVTVVGNVKHVTTIALSLMFFQNQMSLLNALGTFIAIVGAACYSYVDYTAKHAIVTRTIKG